MTLHLKPISEIQPEILKLWREYSTELRQLRNLPPVSQENYSDNRLDLYLGYQDHLPYLIEKDDAIAGLVFIRECAPKTMMIGEFFITPENRGDGTAQEAARTALLLHDGKWEIPFQEVNQRAARFWRSLVASMAGSVFEEELREVPGKPEIPKDVYLTFDLRTNTQS